MKTFIKKTRQKLGGMLSGGFLWIFCSSVLMQLSGFVSSVVVIRNLPKADYGLYVDAYNIYSYIEVFIGLGLANAVLQFCSENASSARKNASFRYSAINGTVFNLGFLVLLLGLGIVYKPDTTGRFIAMMCAYPMVVYGFTYAKNVLRVKRENREYAVVCMVYSVVVFIGNVLFTAVWGVKGLVAAAYFAYLATVIAALIYFRRDGFFRDLRDNSVVLTPADRRELLNYSVLSASTNFVSMALLLLDITCLSFVLGDSEVLADYKVALAIPSAMLFISDSLTVYFYPGLVETFTRDKTEFAQRVRGCLKLYAAMSAVLALLLYLFAPVIIRVIYGEKYIGVIPIFRILSVNFFVNSAARNLLGNVIAAIKKVKMTLIFAGAAGVLNIVLDLLLIRLMGSQGAAVATLIVTAFITALEAIYVYPYIKKSAPRG